MLARVKLQYQLPRPNYTPEEQAKLDAARDQVFPEKDGCYGYQGGSDEQAVESNRRYAEMEASVYIIAGVTQRTLEVVSYTVDIELPDPPSDKHNLLLAEIRGVGGYRDGLLLDRANW